MMSLSHFTFFQGTDGYVGKSKLFLDGRKDVFKNNQRNAFGLRR